MEQERTPPAMKRARPSPPPQAHAADAEDRLSALDDATLHAILARVPLRDAAATTALSRRWPRVFATLPRRHLQPPRLPRRGR
ncbi:putative F-box/FBD/LRR-repeat protein [Panicum miliaceum]|uniref:F-box/FBD/LRR-repeat protein n=1 Tax=Panicum miliaceum TaxID=4540 RepID=A0A3L6RAN1_PANMI|nr:putative F-box/FBD/LRR-repeat protein [Panicum miliaceum]